MCCMPVSIRLGEKRCSRVYLTPIDVDNCGYIEIRATIYSLRPTHRALLIALHADG